jgi:hypothetical protein
VGLAHRLRWPITRKLVGDFFNGRVLADSYHRQVVDYSTWEIGNKGESSYGSAGVLAEPDEALERSYTNAAESVFGLNHHEM